MESVLEKINTACEWLNAKSNNKNAPKVTTQVKWADWDRKLFSPAMAVLWYSEVCRHENNAYNTFWIPNTSTWVEKVSKYLDTTHDWVETFVNQCHNGTHQSQQYTLTVTFDGVGNDIKNTYSNAVLKNPRLEWKKTSNNESLLNEAKHCIEKYGGNSNELPAIPYWTKNPPIKDYESKLISAAYDLFTAIQANQSK